MTDQKPPRLAAGESRTLHALLQFQRESLVRKVAGLDDAAARRSPVGSGTSPLWLIKHVARMEITWVLSRFAGQDVVIPDDAPAPGDTLAGAIDGYRAAWRAADAVAFAGTSLDEPLPRAGRRSAGEPALGADAPARGDRPARGPRGHPRRADRRPRRPLAAPACSLAL